MSDEVVIKVVTLKGEVYRYSNFESIDITSELDTVARSFTITTTPKTPTSTSSLRNFSVGSAINIYIGGEKVLTGFIEQTPISYSGTTLTASISGRSLTGDLIDCNPQIPGLNIAWDNLFWVNGNRSPLEDNETEITAPDVSAIRWSNEHVEKIIAQLIKPYGIHLINHGVDLSTLSPRSFDVSQDKTVLQAIQDLTKSDGLIFSDNADGDLVLTKKVTVSDVMPDILIYGENILTGSADFDATQVFTTYVVKGQSAGSDTVFGSSLNNKGDASCDLLGRARVKYEQCKGQSSNTICSTQASSDALYALSQYRRVTYTVHGWRDSQGNLWKINTLVDIVDDFLGINTINDGAPYIIKKVEFSLSNEGMITTLDVIPQDGVQVAQEQEIKQCSTTKTKTNTKTATTSYSWLNKVKV